LGRARNTACNQRVPLVVGVNGFELRCCPKTRSLDVAAVVLVDGPPPADLAPPWREDDDPSLGFFPESQLPRPILPEQSFFLTRGYGRVLPAHRIKASRRGQNNRQPYDKTPCCAASGSENLVLIRQGRIIRNTSPRGRPDAIKSGETGAGKN